MRLRNLSDFNLVKNDDSITVTTQFQAHQGAQIYLIVSSRTTVMTFTSPEEREANGFLEDGKDATAKKSPNARLEEIMGYGRFQMFQVWVYASLFCFIGAMNTFQLVFTITRKPARCALPEMVEAK